MKRLSYYVHGPGADEPLARYVADTATADWLLADQPGSIIAATDGAGVVTVKMPMRLTPTISGPAAGRLRA